MALEDEQVLRDLVVPDIVLGVEQVLLLVQELVLLEVVLEAGSFEHPYRQVLLEATAQSLYRTRRRSSQSLMNLVIIVSSRSNCSGSGSGSGNGDMFECKYHHH